MLPQIATLNPKTATRITRLAPVHGNGRAFYVPTACFDIDTGTATEQDYRRQLERMAAALDSNRFTR